MLCECLIIKTNQNYGNSLNPCSNGRCSARMRRATTMQVDAVLILVLMEDALRGVRRRHNGYRFVSLNPCSNGRCSARSAHRQPPTGGKGGLNPCSNGRCSARMKWEQKFHSGHRLNPCSNGRCSASASL